MTARGQRHFVRTAFVAAACPLLAFSGPTISGGLDARALHYSSPQDTRVELHGLFLNLRQVWSDDTGDRWIGVAQVDFDNNFQDITPYQVYLQYKGPLGKWNVRSEHGPRSAFTCMLGAVGTCIPTIIMAPSIIGAATTCVYIGAGKLVTSPKK